MSCLSLKLGILFILTLCHTPDKNNLLEIAGNQKYFRSSCVDFTSYWANVFKTKFQTQIHLVELIP